MVTFVFAVVIAACSASASAGPHEPGAHVSAEGGARHVLYLHGRIVQQQGKDAVSSEYGRYMFDAIVTALGKAGAVVHAPLRTADTTTDEAAEHAAAFIGRLLASGVDEGDITIVGASLGAIIAMKTSSRLKRPSLRFVLLGACNDWVRDELRPELHGHFLSIYEQRDPYGASCASVVRNQPTVGVFEELELSTGLSHGFLYRPLPEWVEPTRDWPASTLEGNGRSP